MWPDRTHPAEGDEGSSRGTAVPGTKGLVTASSHQLGQFHDSSVTTGAQGLVTASTGPHTSSCISHTEHGDLCWQTPFRDNIYINSFSFLRPSQYRLLILLEEKNLFFKSLEVHNSKRKT